MGNPRKAWEIQGKHGKSREGMGNPGRVGNPRMVWENPGKHGKYLEMVSKIVSIFCMKPLTLVPFETSEQ